MTDIPRKSSDVEKAADSRDGKTGDQWTSDDFGPATSDLVLKGVDELVAFFVAAGSCELRGAGAEKVKDIVTKFPAQDLDEYAHFAVAVREKLIGAGLLAPGDPTRYQYGLEHLAAIFGMQT